MGQDKVLGEHQPDEEQRHTVENLGDGEVLGQRTQPVKRQAVAEPAEDAAEEEDEHPDGEDISGGSSAKQAVPEAEVEEGQQQSASPALKRLYFVRLPKPAPDDSQSLLRNLDTELERYKTQMQLLNESINIRKITRDSARQSTQDARRAFHEAREAEQAKLAEMEPLRRTRDGQQGGGKGGLAAQPEFRDLLVRTETELDQQVAGLEYRLSHESVPLNEEKNMVRTIKRLQSQRPLVRQFEQQMSEAEAARAAVRAANAAQTGPTLGELELERKTLKETRELKREILSKYEAESDKLDEEVTQAIEERKRLKETQDECYQKLREVQNLSRSKARDYYDNRRFGQKVRTAIKSGDLEGARNLCTQQVDMALAELSTNKGLRTSYLEQWEHQRNQPFSVGYADEDFDEAPPAAAAAGGKGLRGKGQQRGPAASAEPKLSSKDKAQAIIAAALNEAKAELSRSRSQGPGGAPEDNGNAIGGSSNTGGEAAAAAAPAAAGMTGKLREPKAPADAVASSSSAAAVPGSGGLAPPRPPKAARPKAAAPAPAPVVEDEPFVPPPLPAKEKAVDPEASKVAMRERQTEAQRQKHRANERRSKAIERRKAKAAEMQAANMAAQGVVDVASNAAATVQPAADAAAEVMEEVATHISATVDRGIASIKQAVAAGTTTGPQAGAAKPRASEARQAAHRPEGLKLQRPKARKAVAKRPWHVQAQLWCRQNPGPAGGILCAIMMVRKGVSALSPCGACAEP